MQAAQLSDPANAPGAVREPSVQPVLTLGPAEVQPALDLRRQTLNRCWGP